MARCILAFLCSVMCLPAQDLQNRTVMHVMADVSDHWFVPVWSISDFKSVSPNSTNLFTGLGYRGKTWWLEGLVQKQWNSSGGFWSADLRFRKQLGRVSLYLEPRSIIRPKSAFYECVIVEERLWKGLSLRQETESVHRAGKDSIAAGGGLTYSLGRWQDFDFATALVYRAATGKDELRVYLNINRRIRLRR